MSKKSVAQRRNWNKFRLLGMEAQLQGMLAGGELTIVERRYLVSAHDMIHRVTAKNDYYRRTVGLTNKEKGIKQCK